MIVALFGATSKTGRYVVGELVRRGHRVVAIGRDTAKLARLDPRATTAVADLTSPEMVAAAVAGVEIVASLAHARFTSALLAGLPATCRRVVLTGSLRRHTRLHDPAAEAVRQAEALFQASGRRGVMLHPSMIYGAPDDRNVNRLLAYMDRFPRGWPVPVPLPGRGQATVQPVFVDDMVAAFVAAIERPDADGPPIAVAGPAPITYRAFAEACGAAAGRRVVMVPIPSALVAVARRLGRALGLQRLAGADELARAAESKAFDIGPLRQRLGVDPRPFEEGLRLKIARGWYPGASAGGAAPVGPQP
jgi:nucleoside-diphosphate-sugar epimerase